MINQHMAVLQIVMWIVNNLPGGSANMSVTVELSGDAEKLAFKVARTNGQPGSAAQLNSSRVRLAYQDAESSKLARRTSGVSSSFEIKRLSSLIFSGVGL